MQADLASDGGTAAGPGRAARFRGAERAFMIAWPWLLCVAAACSASGRAGETRGAAAAAVLAAGVALFALVGAPVLSPGLGASGERGRAARAGGLALLCGALALPALVAVTLASPSASGTVPCGVLILMLAAYALVRAAWFAGDAYPAVAALWLGGPPFAYYLMRDVLERRADWLLGLGPASGAAWTVLGAGSAWSRLAGAAVVLALAGAALTLLDRGDPSGAARGGPEVG